MSLRDALRLLSTHLVVALVALVVIGGVTRVMEAGLACPDWPLCYGVLLPGKQMNLQVFLEWFHRLDAFLVGLALLVLFIISVLRRHLLPLWLPWLAFLAVGLVALQGALGALTVTGLLSASTVTAHLATALILVLLISGVDQCLAPVQSPSALPRWWLAVVSGTTLVLLGQCILGGIMASQWAVDHCMATGDRCEWLLRHRQMAPVAALSVAFLAVSSIAIPRLDGRVRGLSLSAAALVALQVGLGLLTLRWQLERPALTVAHQLVAALLMAHLGAIAGRTLSDWLQRPVSPSLEVSCG